MSDKQSEATAKRDAAIAARKQAADELEQVNVELRKLAADDPGRPALAARQVVLAKAMGAAETEAETAERELLLATGIMQPPPITISRKTFDALSPKEQTAHCLAGGIISDEPAPKRAQAPLDRNQIRRADFEQMTPFAQMAAMQGGNAIVD